MQDAPEIFNWAKMTEVSTWGVFFFLLKYFFFLKYAVRLQSSVLEINISQKKENVLSWKDFLPLLLKDYITT